MHEDMSEFPINDLCLQYNFIFFYFPHFLLSSQFNIGHYNLRFNMFFIALVRLRMRSVFICQVQHIRHLAIVLFSEEHFFLNSIYLLLYALFSKQLHPNTFSLYVYVYYKSNQTKVILCAQRIRRNQNGKKRLLNSRINKQENKEI